MALIPSHQLIDESLIDNITDFDVETKEIDSLSCVLDQSMFFEMKEYYTSTNNEEKETEQKKRGRKQKYEDYRLRRRIKPVPRILKRDIRRDFAVMYTNAFNSGDPQFFGQFFNRFCISNFEFRIFHHLYSPPYYNDMVTFSSLGSQEQIIPYQIITSQFPDLYTNLKEMNIVQRKNTLAVEIRCLMRTEGTNPLKQLKTIENQPYNSIKIIDFSNIINGSPQHIQEFKQYLNKLDLFVYLEQLSMLVNEDGYIYDISIISKN